MRDQKCVILPSLKKQMQKGRKTLNITLKMPTIDLSPMGSTQLSFNQGVEALRYSSVCENYNKVPQRNQPLTHSVQQTNVLFHINNSSERSPPYCFSPIKTRYFSLPQRASRLKHKKIMISELIIKNRPKNDKETSIDKALYDGLITFYSGVALKYSHIFSQIDRSQKGYIDPDDVIDYYILKQMDYEERAYDSIINTAKLLFQALTIISGHRRVKIRHFLALCSSFESSFGKEFDISDDKCLQTAKEQVIALKNQFDSFTSVKIIDLKSLIADIGLKEKISRCRKFIESDRIDFPRFLRCLPVFTWISNKRISNENHISSNN